jgi:hypothetical protein
MTDEGALDNLLNVGRLKAVVVRSVKILNKNRLLLALVVGFRKKTFTLVFRQLLRARNAHYGHKEHAT